MMESIKTVLQKIHLKTGFTNTAIPSSSKTNFIDLSKEMNRKGIKNPILHWSVIDLANHI